MLSCTKPERERAPYDARGKVVGGSSLEGASSFLRSLARTQTSAPCDCKGDFWKACGWQEEIFVNTRQFVSLETCALKSDSPGF